MSRERPPPNRQRARRLVATLAVTFVLTIASFLASTAISEQTSRGIGDEANRLASTTVPSSEYLSDARSELRHLDEAVDDLVYRHAPHGTIDDELARFADHWSAYLALPNQPGELRLQEETTRRIAEMRDSIERLLERLRAQDQDGAVRELTSHTRAAVRGVLDGLRNASAINLTASARSAEKIEQLRRSSHALEILLDTASALSAAAAAYMVVRMARRFITMTEEQIAEMDRFAGRVAHDVRSPLNAVGLALDIARRSPELDAKTQSMLERATRTLQRIGQLVDGLLLFARAGRTPTDSAGADIAGVLTGVLDDLRRTAEEKHIALEAAAPVPATTIACSEGVLVSIVSNLVGNAIKYMGDSPVRKVTVALSDLGEQVRIEVRDTGPGVPLDQRSRIFEPYTRVNEGTVPGLGLGLATVRRLAEAHDGSVGVESTPGAGSIFWVQLPKAEQHASERSTAPAIA